MQTSLIIDGNFFLYKLVYPLIQTKTLYGDLMNGLNASFKKHVGMYPFHQIWFVSDSKHSWRKEIFPEYKANRKKDDDVDWEFIFNTYAEFKQQLDPIRFVTVEEDGVEGDDWIAHIIKKSNANNISCVVFSSDGDLNQLLSWRVNPDVINIQYRDNINMEKAYMPEGYKVFTNSLRKRELDLFELDWRQDFFNLLDDLEKRYTIVEVDPIASIFKKIVQGDKKDNVSSSFTTFTKTNKPRGIGEAGALKIWNKFRDIYPDNFDFDSKEFIEDVIDLVCEYKKVPLSANNTNTIKNNLLQNIKLLRLEQHYMPSKYYSLLEQKINNAFTI